MSGDLFNQIVAWAGLFSVIPLNFIVPGLLYLKVWQPRTQTVKTPSSEAPFGSLPLSYGAIGSTKGSEDMYSDDDDDDVGSLFDPSECDENEKNQVDDEDEEDEEDEENKGGKDGQEREEELRVADVDSPRRPKKRLNSIRMASGQGIFRTRAYTALSWMPLKRRITLTKCIIVAMGLLNVVALIAKAREDILYYTTSEPEVYKRKKLFDAMAGLVFNH
jgi:hypothetical protein